MSLKFNKNNTRHKKISSRIHSAINDIIRDIAQDYLDKFVTLCVVDVKISSDCRFAKCFVTDYRSIDNTDIEWLNKHKKRIRLELTKRLAMKFSPEIAFTKLGKNNKQEIEDLFNIINSSKDPE